MEEALVEDLLDVGVGHGEGGLPAVDAGRLDGLDVADLDGRHIGQGEEAPARPLPHDGRAAHLGAVPEGLGEALGVAGLVEIVELLGGRAGELLDERRHVRALGDGSVARDPAGRPAQRRQVDVGHLLDGGTLDLHDHVPEAHVAGLRARQPRPMRLPERGGRQRLGLELLVGFRQGQAQLRLGDPPDRVEGHRRRLVLEAGELVGDGGRQHVEAGRHELAELDHEPAELGGQRMEAHRRGAQALLAAPLGQPAQPQARQYPVEEPLLRDEPREVTQDAPVTGPKASAATHTTSAGAGPRDRLSTSPRQGWCRPSDVPRRSHR